MEKKKFKHVNLKILKKNMVSNFILFFKKLLLVKCDDFQLLGLSAFLGVGGFDEDCFVEC
jgi:hypothetical protein